MTAVVQLSDVLVRVADGTTLLRLPDWSVHRGEHWALLGPNGAGKTTVLSLANGTRHPTGGEVRILGHQLGRVDVRELWRDIGSVDPTRRMPTGMTVLAVVLTGASGTVQPAITGYRSADHDRAGQMLETVGMSRHAGRDLATLSAGERARVRIARALMPDPRLLLLDEPAAALDLAAREELLATMESLAAHWPGLATVTVSHHLEELPATTTHALLLRAGIVVACGSVDDALTSATVSDAFGVDVRVHRADGRWLAIRSRP